jgi:hypothetical protein
MAMNAGKSKWMAFLPRTTTSEAPDRAAWKIEVAGELIENVDEFHYLGFRLDCYLDNEAHVKLINEWYLKAAQVTGRLMNELRCSNLINLRRFFVSLVFSQLYGLVFVDETKIEFERGIGIFLKASLGLPLSFPHVVAAALLGVKHISVFQMEQRVKFLMRWETQEKYPTLDMLLMDRAVLFPCGVGINFCMGEILNACGMSRTIDYCECFRDIMSGLEAKAAVDRGARLLSTEGRAMWTELGHGGSLNIGLRQTLSSIPFDSMRIFTLLLADMLCWCSLRVPTRSCPTCKLKFTTSHFFSCPRLFVQDSAWNCFVRLCQSEEWEELVDFSFEVLGRWTTETEFFRAGFSLNVLEYTNVGHDSYVASLRRNL